ncbi:uncharacterized protein [Haliotis asinina]|uniref:uncharacterized protein n=1 Tax=Haliotis asinina TaxID=109174 RepID=UPI003531EC08
MADGSRVMADEGEEDADETVEELENTILGLCSDVQPRTHMVEASGVGGTSKDLAGSQERSLLNNLSPIKRAEQEVAVVTPLTHSWMGTAQSTPITDTAHCPVYSNSRRGLLYPSGPDLQMRVEDGDSFTSYENIYDDGKTYEELLLEVSQICGGSVVRESNDTGTNISRINVGEIVSASEKPPTGNALELSCVPDIGDEKYFAQTLTSSAMSGRFTGVQKSRHVFDESTAEIDPEPSTDILGLDKFICSDLDEEDNDDSVDEDNATVISTYTVLNTSDASIHNSVVSTDPVSQGLLQINNNECLKETRCNSALNMVRSLSHSRSSVDSKESGELSDTLLESDDCGSPEATPVKTVPFSMRKRKRRLLTTDSDREEGELTLTTTDASASEVEELAEAEEELGATLVQTTSVQDILTDDIPSTAKSEPHGVVAEPAERPCEKDGEVVASSEVSEESKEALGAAVEEDAIWMTETTIEELNASTAVPRVNETEMAEASPKFPKPSGNVSEALPSTEALKTFTDQPEVKDGAGHGAKPKSKGQTVLPPQNILCDENVLSLTEDDDDLSKKKNVKSLMSGKCAQGKQGKSSAFESFEDSMISEMCEKLMKEKDLTNLGSFVVIDSPEKNVDESFVVVSENAVSASSDTIDKDVKKDTVIVKTKELCNNVSEAEGTTKISSTNIVKAMPKDSPVSAVKQGILYSPITAPETKKTCSKSEARIWPTEQTKKTCTKPGAKISPTDQNVLEYETGLMKSVRLKWSSRGIHRPDENLTYSSWVRRTQTSRKVEPTFILEGNSREPPLFRRRSVPNSKLSENSSRPGSPERKKPRIGGTPGKANGDSAKSIKSVLQKQLMEIQVEENRMANVMTMQREAFLGEMRLKHGKMFQALRTQQNLERRQHIATWKGYISQALLEYQLMQLKQEHMLQVKQLETVNRMELQRGMNVINQKGQAQAKRFQSLKLPALQSIKNLEENTASGAQMDEAHTTVNLCKGPFHPGGGERNMVKVCLPVDVAAFMIREDEVYDSNYEYS